MDLRSLRNEYFALRHGQSLANVANTIASNPDMAITHYGLSELGQQQADQAADDIVQMLQNSPQHNTCYQGVVILSSDFLRAKETAESVANSLLARVLNIPLYDRRVVIDVRLRERWFGDWDGGPDVHYHDVWKDDALDPTHERRNVESVISVMDRSTQCIVEWDTKVSHHLIVCVAHGDVLQILQTAFMKVDGRFHRTVEHLDTAKLRPLRLVADQME